MNARRQSDALHERTRALIRAFETGSPPPEPFDTVAADLARFQAEHVEGYKRLCAARGVDPRRIRRAADAPAVPTEAFKLGSVFAFEPAEASVTFRTSGTTVGARGSHAIRDVRTYNAAALALGRPALFGGDPPPAAVLVLGPSPRECPDSSLSHMCALFARTFGDESEDNFFVRDGELRVDALAARVASLPPARSAIVLATSFALVHLLDALGNEVLALPSGSRVMQTGGFKGRSREVSPAALRTASARGFGLPEGAIIGEYGMTELSSQFWQSTPAGDAAAGVYTEPPWARVVPVDADTLLPVADGTAGIARIEDLANIDSAFAILAQDRVRRLPGGFELVGRVTGAPARGCSIGVDEILTDGEFGASVWPVRR